MHENLSKSLRELLLGASGLLEPRNDKGFRPGFLGRSVKKESGDGYRTVMSLDVAAFPKKDANQKDFLSVSIAGGLLNATLYPENGKYGSVLAGSVGMDDTLRIVARPIGYNRTTDGDLAADVVAKHMPNRLQLSIYERKANGAAADEPPPAGGSGTPDIPF